MKGFSPEFSSSWLVLVAGSLGLLFNIGVVLIGQDRRADFVFAALFANHTDQFAAADFQGVILAKLVELLQVNTRHDSNSEI